MPSRIGLLCRNVISRSRCVKASLAVGPPRIHGVLLIWAANAVWGHHKVRGDEACGLALALAKSLPCAASFPRLLARICLHSSMVPWRNAMVREWGRWCLDWGRPSHGTRALSCPSKRSAPLILPSFARIFLMAVGRWPSN